MYIDIIFWSLTYNNKSDSKINKKQCMETNLKNNNYEIMTFLSGN